MWSHSKSRGSIPVMRSRLCRIHRNALTSPMMSSSPLHEKNNVLELSFPRRAEATGLRCCRSTRRSTRMIVMLAPAHNVARQSMIVSRGLAFVRAFILQVPRVVSLSHSREELLPEKNNRQRRNRLTDREPAAPLRATPYPLCGGHRRRAGQIRPARHSRRHAL